jgi:hypothetical protein
MKTRAFKGSTGTFRSRSTMSSPAFSSGGRPFLAPPRMRTAVRGNLDGQCVRELATEPLPQGAPYLLSSPPSAGREGGLATALGAADSPARGRKTMAGGSAAVTPDACFSQVAIPVTNTGYVWIRSSAAEVEPIDRRISICRGRRSSRRLGDFLLTIEFPLAVLDFLCRQAIDIAIVQLPGWVRAPAQRRLHGRARRRRGFEDP